MFSYEVMYIVKPMDNDDVNAIVEKFNKLIVDNGGEVTGTDIWGKKRLAYEIQELSEGIYILVSFNAKDDTVRELNRVLCITEDVMRHMIIRKGY